VPSPGNAAPAPTRSASRRGSDGYSAAGYGQATLFVVGIWVLGLFALGAVIEFDRRVDETRRAEVVIAQMRNQQGTLIQIAFDPAVAGSQNAPGRAETRVRLAQAKSVLSASVATLSRLGHSDEPGRISALTTRYYALADRLSELVAANASGRAALELGASQRPGGVQAELNAAFDRADLDYAHEATSSRRVATLGTIAAVVSLLFAFSIAFRRSVRERRLSEHEAKTDALTGLGNRRKLFADMERKVNSLGPGQTVTIAIFDLDGFKSYNDSFGHPAGDALLSRLGYRLAAVVGDVGSVYRIGGDEFVLATTSVSEVRVIKAAQAALSESGHGFRIGCSVGSARVVAGGTLEQGLHVADQMLYVDKRSGKRSDARTEVKDVLLQVLAEQSGTLVDHLDHVADFAWSTAVKLDLPAGSAERARLAAELHDIGKAAIPNSILNKPGPLDHHERMFMQRHSEIGERIVAAAPTLREIAPIIRSAHERLDGTGYPDGLSGEQIPICARIIAVVDAYDAMTTNRPYQQAMSREDAVAELEKNAGTQFDPSVVTAFAAVLAETTLPDRLPETEPRVQETARNGDAPRRHSRIERVAR
jgi:diguanylate cyclase (GGDEF)-like protein